ncbi:MAG: D-2-hydroxyacid dehydrogenase [Pigmentiphaga sp.]|uniref:D-2-hydroxyacid dehydrogenase n=1 Tax=Pigmentiphaga sp. TaxID=1977564 RepID=UPI0029A981BD|nr:D-2-hydroxyacid dehydrogenase [Pigmentiphaga sp.]MDX3906322.1 D-2-hydroxyacid dehydrogenase [Pigmentiphaga sp.]
MRLLYWANANLARAQITARLHALDGVELVTVERLEEAIAMLPSADAICLCDPPLPQARQLVAALGSPDSRVRWMHILTAGRENLEKAGLPPHLAVTFAAGAASAGVAEHAMALMLALCRRLPDAVTAAARHAWDRTMVPRAAALEGSTLAIIGYGHIGRHLARRARAFDMQVLAVSRSAQRDEWVDEALPLTQLHAALERADVVVVCVALTPQTRHLLGAAEFARCKRGALLVNVARGEVIDQAALGEALASGQLGGAGLDVTDPEPLPESDPLWRAPNLLLTPHYAGAGSPRGLARIADGLAENATLFMAGKELKHRI